MYTKSLPNAAAAPYSQGIKAAGQIWVSGQLPADATGKLIEGSIAEKTEACCKNVKAILEAGGSSIEKVVKVTVCMICFNDITANSYGVGVFDEHG